MNPFDAYEVCDRCGGCGYSHLIGPLFTVCRPCGGAGERIKTSRRIWRLIRHGLASGEDY